MISEQVRRYAEDPAPNNPNLPPEMIVLDERFSIFLGLAASVTLVGRLRLQDEDVAATVEEVRTIVAERGHQNASWSVGTSATPHDLVERLLACGLRREDRPGTESRLAVMVTETPLDDRAHRGIESRQVRSYAEFVAATRIDRAAFGSDKDLTEWLMKAPDLWERHQSGRGARVYLAFMEGQPVGAARAILDPHAVMLLGGCVLAHARGHGVYRSLLEARWRDAVAAGTPALAVHAGEMSRPILEKLGFEQVAQVEQLYDPATT